MSFKAQLKEKYTIDVDVKTFKSDLRTVGYVVTRNCITAMAFNRKVALPKLESLALPITEHLMMIAIMPRSASVPHWQAELKAWQNELRRYNKSKLKSGSNYSLKTLNKYLWDQPLGTPQDRIVLLKILGDEGYAVPKKLTPNQEQKLKKMVEMFYSKILI